MTDAAVELRDVFCVHRTSEGDAAALGGLSLELHQGEVLCLLGPSGAGKSTLLRVVAGIQEPSAGIVSVLGVDLRRLRGSARARLRNERVGLLAQSASAALSPDLPTGQAVELPLAIRGTPRAERRARVGALLASAGLAGRAGALASELSGGERQRVQLCAAIAHRPALLLADEPTGELDMDSAKVLLRLIADLAHNEGTSVIIASHDRATAELADRTVRIRDGRVVEEHRVSGGGIVVGRGGWLQLPPELLHSAGVGRRAHVRHVPGGLLLSPDPDASEPTEPPPSPAPQTPIAWSPVLAEVRTVTRAYGEGAGPRTVLDGLTHRFEPGRLTAVTGRSGSGKTTLLALLAALDIPDAGQVAIDEQALDGAGREQLATLRRERIGYMAQDPRPVGFLSAEENVVLTLRVRGWAAEAALARARAVLALAGLADRSRQRLSRLSAGEVQRVALSRALASARGLLIVDEPTSRLDEANAATVADLLAQAAARDHQTVVCATHDPVVIACADAQLALA
jgi:ABC-type lipoprotein export system ATPase subunit